ncbi:hypothetical protein ACFQ9X_21370 [Catenulispora yoronensis]
MKPDQTAAVVVPSRDIADLELERDGDLRVAHSLVPAAQCSAGGVFEDCDFVVVSGKGADGFEVVEEGDRGELDLLAVFAA